MALVGTGQITVVDVNDGLDANLTNDSAVLPADSIGNVSSFAGAETTFVIREAGVNTSASWTFYVSATGGGISYRDSDDAADRTGTGTTNGLITGTTGYVKVTALSQDLSYLDITATKGSLTVVKRFSVVKAKAGATGATGPTGATGATGAAGANGTRGTIISSQATSGTSWVDSEAVTAIANAGGGTPIQGDVVTLYNNAQNFSQTRVRSSGGTWTALTALFGGDVIVDNTLNASKIVADSITAGKIAAGAIGATQIAADAITSTKIATGAIAVGTAAIADGAIVNAMIGNLSADKITAGTLSADRIGANTLTADKINGNNLVVTNGTFSGVLQAATGTFSGSLSAATGTFAGRLAAGVLDPSSFNGVTNIYSNAGSFTVTVPSNSNWTAVNMRFTLQGAGGGGGGAHSSRSPAAGGGGGAGAAVTVTIANVTPGATYTLVIGTRGSGAYGYANGGNGGNTTFAGYSATGGTGGGGADSGAQYPLHYGAGGSIGGQNGSVYGTPYGGAGGSSAYGAGGAASVSPNPYGVNGNAGGSGAGGSGAVAVHTDNYWVTGGNGGNGYAIIEFFDPNSVVTNVRYSNLITWLDGKLGTVPSNAR